MDQWPLPSCSLQSQRRSSSDRFARSRSITSSSTRRPSAMGDLNEARILIVDDELANVRLLERLLQQTGYRNLVTTTDPRQARGLYDELHPDLILLDLMMPPLDGVAVMGELAIPAEAYVPILVLTADVTMAAKQRALAAGAKDFLTKPFDRIEVLLRIKNLLDTRSLYLELERQNRSLEAIVAERTQRLLQSEKVATMGSLLAGVAHELNNPLAVLTGHAHLLREGAKDESLASRAEKIQAAADRCARIVKNFLALARQRPPERGAVSVNMVIQGALEMLAYELRTDSVEVTCEFAAGLPPLWADSHQLHQVLVNLIANAHHAMRKQPKPAPRRIRLASQPDREHQRVRLTAPDTGPGIAPEIREKIFEPFFTTKPAGEGTGLGLSLCRGIIEEHGGTISIQSEPGQGATFVIELPLVERATAEAARPAKEARRDDHGGRLETRVRRRRRRRASFDHVRVPPEPRGRGDRGHERPGGAAVLHAFTARGRRARPPDAEAGWPRRAQADGRLRPGGSRGRRDGGSECRPSPAGDRARGKSRSREASGPARHSVCASLCVVATLHTRSGRIGIGRARHRRRGSRARGCGPLTLSLKYPPQEE